MFTRYGVLIVLTAIWRTATAHTVITYPGWRGDNLMINGTLPQFNPGSRGIDFENDTMSYPWGMEWIYPCGGMPQSVNRTKWPINGGAVAVQPGWFPGHSLALFYVNIGIQAPGELAPPNMSHNVVPPFQLVGPSNFEYNGTFCIPQVPLPANVSLNIGDNITIQVVETAQHGAALYNCVDVTLADPSEVDQVNSSNCFNSSDLGFHILFTTSSLGSAQSSLAIPTATIALASMLATMWTIGIW